jgi:hypothetical protein
MILSAADVVRASGCQREMMSSKKTGIAILSIMGLLWCLVGAITLPHTWRMTVIAGALIVYAALLYANASRPSALTKLDGETFALAVAFEVIGIAAAAGFLLASHQPTYILAAIAVVVGLHFIGMWLATDNKAYLGIAAAMCGVGLASVFLPSPARMQVAGLGSAIVLWVGAAQGINAPAPTVQGTK